MRTLRDGFEDFNLTHLYYSKIRDAQSVPAEQNIVLVNTGGLSRRELAEQLAVLGKYNPKVIGMGMEFFEPDEEDPIGDFMLEQTLKNTQNVVMVSELHQWQEAQQAWDSLRNPPQEVLAHVTTGFANNGDRQPSHFPFWGEIPPKETLKNGQIVHCFALKVMEQYDANIADEFLRRNNAEEVIYFKGNLEKYPKLEAAQVAQENFTAEMIEGKIVLLGYMGTDYGDYFFEESKFYTPLNSELMGRGEPDMFGIVVQANILSMMLERNYIAQMPAWLSALIAFLVCYFNIVLFSQIVHNPKLAVWYNGISKVIQLFEAIFVYLINLIIFDVFKYQADFTATIFVIIVSGDLCEIYIDIVLNAFKKLLLKFNL